MSSQDIFDTVGSIHSSACYECTAGKGSKVHGCKECSSTPCSEETSLIYVFKWNEKKKSRRGLPPFTTPLFWFSALLNKCLVYSILPLFVMENRQRNGSLSNNRIMNDAVMPLWRQHLVIRWDQIIGSEAAIALLRHDLSANFEYMFAWQYIYRPLLDEVDRNDARVARAKPKPIQLTFRTIMRCN